MFLTLRAACTRGRWSHRGRRWRRCCVEATVIAGVVAVCGQHVGVVVVALVVAEDVGTLVPANGPFVGHRLGAAMRAAAASTGL